ncbi:aminopeptidase P family protein [Streptococcus pyogenes]|uniref:aminopeptidase P family protein n=1 Tax=Streptococcus pyogenes TaxID=1314 RepID=UPI0007C64A40|nr:Xaa-Pro peptidase family protein [Streptococcus pyogenes]NAZ56109.1 M24 family metallopeptidase [Streptococcus pyogenes]OAF75472.1 dipeptidase [Streptococcus pyogenes]RXS34115.1 aminopeptidase P family protein [Streptococcus pyogenes]WVM38695.1 Xaa-Pro peptidase family protein [Streptococcus pyogenes]WVM42042.1 Xaa-Pro peptidase family protein [Streptococcus pyogenes]
MTKLDQIRLYLDQKGAELAIFSDPVTINYLTGFFCDPHERQLFLFVYHDLAPVLFVPALEVARASQAISFPVFGYVDSENPWEKIKAVLPNTAAKTIYAEFDHLNVNKFHGLQTIFSGQFNNLTPYVQGMRLIKSADEINKMMIAGQFADKAIQVGFDNISLDATETDVIAQIEFEMKKQGIHKMSFDTMVLTGNNAANPHGIPGTNNIENNALLLFDLGVETLGYTSDMTRTVAVGQPDQFKIDIYNLCLEAQLAAIDFIKPGVTAAQVDAAARQVIEKAGYGEYFNHRLGHGIGMDVHEFPSIMAGNDLVLEEGMCFSVEPGIYIPGKVGVRIEDCGHVTKNGFEVFTHTPKELLYFEG